jgi:hypothetical protein
MVPGMGRLYRDNECCGAMGQSFRHWAREYDWSDNASK